MSDVELELGAGSDWAFELDTSEVLVVDNTVASGDDVALGDEVTFDDCSSTDDAGEAGVADTPSVVDDEVLGAGGSVATTAEY